MIPNNGRHRDIPLELWTYIFKMACTDNGFTGRSLSLVSKYIREASKPVKFQCIAIRKFDQIIGFASALENTPAECRRVLHLHITDDQEPSQFSRRLVTRGETRLYQQKLTQLTPKANTNILRLTASSLRSLAIMLHVFPVIPEVPFPSLTELAIIECQLTSFPIASYPAVRRLHIQTSYHLTIERLKAISTAFPCATHMLFSGQGLLTLDHSLIQIERNKGRRSMALEGLPSTLEKVVIVGGAHQIRENIKLLAARDDRFVIVERKPHYWRSFSSEELLDLWSERINGGEGCWDKGSKL